MTAERNAHTRAGQVLVVMLLALTLLIGLVFYVLNVGDQGHVRVEMQNAADSAAISAAGWMAKCMNVVAMNNVAITRMLALVPTLDAFPLSTIMAHEEVSAWVQCLEWQLAHGVTDDLLREGLESLRDRMVEQRDILAPISQYFNDGGVDMEQLTTWSIRNYGGAPPHGRLWQAAEAMDLLSQVTADSAGMLAQKNAVYYGADSHAEIAFSVPLLPELPHLPVERTSYSQFESPVKRGVIPDREWPQRLGPYDKLYKWRNYQYKNIRERDRWVAGRPGHGATRGGNANVSVGGRTRGRSARGSSTNPDGHWASRTVARILMGYTPYGPYEWMRRRVHGYAQGWWQNQGYYAGKLADTFFHEYHRNIADIKLGYMWGPQTLKVIHYPQWHVDYPAAKAIAEDPSTRVTRTMFYLVEIRSKYPKGDSRFLQDESGKKTYKTNGDLPIAMWVNGWNDPAEWNIPKINDWIWEDQWDYETTEDWDINIRMVQDSTGNPVWQKVYMVSMYVFGGIDVGGEVEVTNPSNYTSHEGLPAPTLIDVETAGDYDPQQPHHDLGVRRTLFTYFGAAAKSDSPRVWPSRFDSGNPFGRTVAVAQAEIFNNASWDLWTQNWDAKLVPVSQWQRWMALMEATAEDAAVTDGLVNPEDVLEIHTYLSRFDPTMVNEMMNSEEEYVPPEYIPSEQPEPLL